MMDGIVLDILWIGALIWLFSSVRKQALRIRLLEIELDSLRTFVNLNVPLSDADPQESQNRETQRGALKSPAQRPEPASQNAPDRLESEVSRPVSKAEIFAARPAPMAHPSASPITRKEKAERSSAPEAHKPGAKLQKDAASVKAAADAAHDAKDDGKPFGRGRQTGKDDIPVPASPAPGPQGIETALGTRWAVWVGGVALALGGLFLVRYSIEAGYFGPAMRIFLASLMGLTLLGAGEFIRRTGYQLPLDAIESAHIPAILTPLAHSRCSPQPMRLTRSIISSTRRSLSL